MTMRRLFQSASITGTAAFFMLASAGATPIIYSTNAAGTGFGGTSLILTSASGEIATLTFIPNVNIQTGVPSNVNFGNFTLYCAACQTQRNNVGAYFTAFEFDLIITDVSDGGATGKFVGSSIGGSVYSDVSQITINWAPLQLGPGTNNATSGNFGPTIFTTTVFTGIVAPNSGPTIGLSTVQGYVDGLSIDLPVPEPLTLSLVGGALLGLGLVRPRRFFA